MKVHYTGRQAELSETQKRKLEQKFQKTRKILGKWYEPEAHVIVSAERGRYAVEVTVNHRHHTLVVECSGTKLFPVAQEAVDKLVKQIIRDRDKWRERKRRAKQSSVRFVGEGGSPAVGLAGSQP